MTWEYIVQGDAEAACISILNAATEISGFAGGAPRVSSDAVGYQMKARWITVSREGGSMIWPKVDKPRVDFNVYAETRTVAHNLAQIAQAAMFRAMGQAFPDFGLCITDVKIETGIFRIPDKETGSPRYVFSLRLTCVPISS